MNWFMFKSKMWFVVQTIDHKLFRKMLREEACAVANDAVTCGRCFERSRDAVELASKLMTREVFVETEVFMREGLQAFLENGQLILEAHDARVSSYWNLPPVVRSQPKSIAPRMRGCPTMDLPVKEIEPAVVH